jgi:TRAP transporter 4TM/12TM fusion protein
MLAAYYYYNIKVRGFSQRILSTMIVIILVISGFYLYIEYDRLIYTLTYTYPDLFIAGIMLLLILNYVRKFNKVLFYLLIALFIITTPYIGMMLPEPFTHVGLPLIKYITSNTLETTGLTSIFGTLTIIGLEIIAPILFLMGFMKSFGILESVGRIIIGLIKRPALIPLSNPIISSYVGTVTGSIASDTAITGSITIPLMKRINIPSEWAGAIAAVSGVIAYIMPPIMGVVAFIMPVLIGSTYWDVVIRAFLPAITFAIFLMLLIYIISARYTSAYVSQEIKIERTGIKPMDYMNLLGFIMTLAILITMIGIAGYELPVAIYYAFIAFIAYSISLKIINCIASKHDLKSFIREVLTPILRGISEGARDTINVVLLLASLGIMINLLTVVGFIQDFNWLILNMTGESLWLLIAVTYIFGFMMGLALPASVTYISIAVLLIPAMTSLGIDKWAAHFFAFYLAVLSEFTPPTSIAAVVAAGIAKTDPMKVMMRMLILGLSVYLFPLIILINPQVLSFSLEGIATLFIIFSILSGLAMPVLLITLKIINNVKMFIVSFLLMILAIMVLLFTEIFVKILLSSAIIILTLIVVKLIFKIRIR